MRILLENENTGICDLVRDPQNIHTFTGRLDSCNQWKLKPVSFALEFFQIQHEGRNARLTAVRFTQIGGSAASFRKLAVILKKFLTRRGHLLKRQRDVRQIVRIVQTGVGSG